MDVKYFFEKFEKPSFFSRVDNIHILELHLGLDEKRRKAIELRSSFTPRKVTGTASIEVNQFKKPDYNVIRFSLNDEEISGLFYLFCNDLIEQTRTIKERAEGYNAIVNRFLQWKKMFISNKGNLLTEPEIMGLIGELLYLKGPLSQTIGLYEAINSWSGQKLTHKDFSYCDNWTEVKTIRAGGTTVKISSIEQLDSDHEGELAVYQLERMSAAYNGVTLNNLILEIRNMITPGDDRDHFLAEVALQGYEYNDYYDDYVYEVVRLDRYRVHEAFPRIKKEEIHPAIKKASYEIALTDISEFEL